MSYKPPKSEDSLNAYFSRLSDFMRVAPNLLECDNPDSFLIWFEKLKLIDPRTLYYYMRKHKDCFTEEMLNIANAYYAKYNIKI